MTIITIKYLEFYYQHGQHRAFLYPKPYRFNCRETIQPRQFYQLTPSQVIYIESVEKDLYNPNLAMLDAKSLTKPNIGKPLLAKLTNLPNQKYIVINQGSEPHDHN